MNNTNSNDHKNNDKVISINFLFAHMQEKMNETKAEIGIGIIKHHQSLVISFF